MNTIEVLTIEAAIIQLTTALRLNGAPDADVSRDLCGTLHVNLCVLMRAADRAATALETKHGFIRSTPRADAEVQS